MSRLVVPTLRAVTVVLVAIWLGGTTAAAQGAAPSESGDVEQIVVMIRCALDREESIGAGIVFGAANDRLYVVTANHVVRHGPAQCSDLRVELRSRPGEPVPATLTTSFDAKRDVAVLSIPNVRALGIDVTRLPFDRLGEPASLSRGDGVFVLGYPEGRPWGTNVAPIPVQARSDSVISFEATLVSPGYSGGALLNQRREIVGLLLNVQPPEATARSVTPVAELLRTWRFPVALRGRFALAEPELVSAGAGFSCALRRDGAAFCWGSNDHGELGTGARGVSLSPAPVSTSLKFASVSAGSSYACALTVLGAAYCWGDAQENDFGPVSGSPVQRRVPARVAGDLTFSSLSAGYAHACGVTSASAVYCWGENDEQQLGNGSNAASATPVRVAASVPFRSVSAGFAHSCALALDGTAYCWGNNSRGALGTGDRASHGRPVLVSGGLRFSTISAGAFYTCAVTTARFAYCWGSNEFGQLGHGTSNDATAPRAVAGQHRFRTVSVDRTGSRGTTCAIATDDRPLCWGWESEALGQHSIDDSSRPGAVDGELTLGAVSVGFSHVCGMAKDGGIYCWGNGRYGQLGDGATDARITPELVPLP